tara:strand:- start:8113 stop:8454 length:342 start_codon:yes stop_codon:yes gene_type:complete
MSIFRTEEFQTMEASRQPYDGPPQAIPLNRTALNWLMGVVADRALSPDARSLATFVGTEALAGRSHSVGVSFLLTSGAGLSRSAASRAIGELTQAELIEFVDGEIYLLAQVGR